MNELEKMEKRYAELEEKFENFQYGSAKAIIYFSGIALVVGLIIGTLAGLVGSGMFGGG